MGTSVKHILIFQHSEFPKIKIWKRRAPKNDEDPSELNLEILNMGSISPRKGHEHFIFLFSNGTHNT